MGKQTNKTMPRWLVVAGLTAVLAAAVLPVQAGLINSDTGEVYQPSFDEDGNLEEPPEWVPGSGDDEPPFQSEVVR
jgi:hypothetical protein